MDKENKAIAPGAEAQLVIKDEMLWDEYKELLSDATAAARRIELIEKYVTVAPEFAAQGVTLGQVKMSRVLKAFGDLMQGAANPNS